MATKDELIIQKLIKIADKQQQIIKALAQAVQQADPEVVAYLKRAIPVAASQPGIEARASVTDVTFSPGHTEPGTQPGSNTNVHGNYMADISGIPAPKRDAFAKIWQNQLQAQKPELSGIVSYRFID